MVKYTINGSMAPLGTLNSGLGFNLTNFPDDVIEFRIDFKGRTIDRKVNIGDVIREALTYIDTHCARNRTCNDYFASLNKRSPITLRQILDEKNLHIYRLGSKEDKDLPAGYTMGWGDAYAQIGLNRLSLTDSGHLAGVLLHELAHVAGAPGRDENPNSLAAETSLLRCGLSSHYDAEAKG